VWTSIRLPSKHIEFSKYEKRAPKQQQVDIMGYISFIPKMKNVSFYQEGTRYCAARKYSTETIFNASRLIKRFDRCYKTV